MVTYAETVHVAHLVVHDGVDDRGARYVTLCGRGRRRNYSYGHASNGYRMNLSGDAIVYRAGRDGQVRHYDRQWPRWSDAAPGKPWCTDCVRRIRDEAIDVGLL